MKIAIPYYRVSTDKQGQSGLGLEAQQKAVHDFAKANEFTLGKEFTEVESGRNNKRPILVKALQACKKGNAVLLIAKLDRLSRNVAFISKLLEAKVDFVAVDNPHANKMVVQLLAVFSEFERDQISHRTKEALKAAKRRGVELGKHGKEVLSKQNKQSADDFAMKMQPIVSKLKSEGFKTLKALAQVMNERKIKTYTKTGKWHINSVHSLVKRIALINKKNK